PVWGGHLVNKSNVSRTSGMTHRYILTHLNSNISKEQTHIITEIRSMSDCINISIHLELANVGIQPELAMKKTLS
ncbi:hypothetical protein PMAYCL1PPCAC_13601, partial [Pristionchus mayeri]